MKIVESANVDLISPFPENQLPRVYGWLHCYRSLMDTDDAPRTPEEVALHLAGALQLPHVTTWGIIDKHKLTNSRHEAPLVGFIMFERVSPYNGYFHLTTTRLVWVKKHEDGSKTHLVDEALALAVADTFASQPQLQRVSLVALENNYAVRSLAKRLGFEQDGFHRAMTLQRGVSTGLRHFAYLRPQPLAIDSAPVENREAA